MANDLHSPHWTCQQCGLIHSVGDGIKKCKDCGWCLMNMGWEPLI